MNYHPDDFIALTEEVRAQGGADLPDVCTGREIAYKIGKVTRPVKTTECGNQSMFAVSYQTNDRVIPGPAFARVCAVDDAVGAWPRFRDKLNHLPPLETEEDEL